MKLHGIKKRLRQSINNAATGGRFPLLHSMESVYQRLVQRDLAKLGIEDDFYPVAGAANYGLLYLIVRLAKELPLKQVVELGAGESTRLLDALARNGTLSAKIVTIEHNDEWAARIEGNVRHDVICTGLMERAFDGVSFRGYDFSAVPLPGNIELLIVDGPPASTEQNRFARLGAVDLLALLNSEAFVVVLDDTERSGEMLLIDKIESELHRRGKKFAKGQIISSKRQTIFAGGAYERAAYF